jgi:hypothetical protein
MKLMKVVAMADGRPGNWAGTYLHSADFDANAGIGDMAFTSDPQRAMRFADARAALELWRTQSTVLPLRPDGKPNRPLTALTIEIVEAPELDPLTHGQGTTRDITRTSILSGKTRTLRLTAPLSEWYDYERGGKLIQHALPSLSDSDREFLKTGITDDEWKALERDEDEPAA